MEGAGECMTTWQERSTVFAVCRLCFPNHVFHGDGKTFGTRRETTSKDVSRENVSLGIEKNGYPHQNLTNACIVPFTA